MCSCSGSAGNQERIDSDVAGGSDGRGMEGISELLKIFKKTHTYLDKNWRENGFDFLISFCLLLFLCFNCKNQITLYFF